MFILLLHWVDELIYHWWFVPWARHHCVERIFLYKIYSRLVSIRGSHHQNNKKMILISQICPKNEPKFKFQYILRITTSLYIQHVHEWSWLTKSPFEQNILKQEVKQQTNNWIWFRYGIKCLLIFSLLLYFKVLEPCFLPVWGRITSWCWTPVRRTTVPLRF